MWTKLVYDTFYYTHTCDIKALGITVEDLEDGSYNTIYDLNGLRLYNDIFKNDKSFIIPESLFTEHSNIYQFILYQKVVNNLTQYIAIFNVNTYEMEIMIKNNIEIPFKNYLILNVLRSISGIDILLYSTNNSVKTNNTVNLVSSYIETPSDYISEKQINDPDFININLFKYQKASINWMLEREKSNKIYYSTNNNFEFGNLIYDDDINDIIHKDDRPSIDFKGGALIDDVGLGKTIQMILLSLLNPITYKDYINNDIKMFQSKATLILAPNQLCSQWENEILTKIKDPKKINIIKIRTKTDLNKKIKGSQITYKHLLEADFVIVSFTFLENEVFTSKWLPSVCNDKAAYKKHLWNNNIHDNAKKIFNMNREELIKDSNSLNQTYPLIHYIHWHRVIIDEFHETYTKDQSISVNNIMKHIPSTFRWCATATPLAKKLEGIIETICFTTNNMYINEEIINDNNIINYISNNLFRKNTKESVEKYDKYSIPEVQNDLQILKFSITEWMMYNSYVANPKNDEFSEYLRQLCCHPQLSDEFKASLSNCKTLDEIQETMINIHKEDVKTALNNLEKCKKRLFRVKVEIIGDFLTSRLSAHKNLNFSIPDKLKTELIKYYDIDIDGNGFKNNVDVVKDFSVFNNYINEVEEYHIKILKFNKNTSSNYEKYFNFENEIVDINNKILELTSIYNGKLSTETFFNNVFEKLKKNKTKVNKEITLDDISNLESLDDLDFDDDDEVDNDEDSNNCPICLQNIPSEDIVVTKCGHIYCGSCLSIVIDKQHKCPMCPQNLSHLDIFKLNINKEQTDEESELINKQGTKLAFLINKLRNTNEKSIIFSQWDDLLVKVGQVLNKHDIKNIFCKGNCYQRDKAISEFKNNQNIKVIMLSSKNTASGINLTEATNVILLDPIYGDINYRRNQERQAIGRSYRTGQTKNVKVIRLIIKDTVEEKIYKHNLSQDSN